ncbi:spermatogenesis-associated protein 4 isoform X3 [Acanthopagrus latus]|uniref:spermatogenesis-associated protein 4 isoform X3 n=1 Tax=Acanthopagrus latus TaxID=8177 RepID=UPI00187C9030|nr:spermatogenesis-associated protein 4 isoform X3 [Acanthopagrus latus]
MSYPHPPKRTGLPREVVKWLHGLELSFYPKNVRRDFSNGYLVAEIFSHYYPQDFSAHSYDKGTSLSAKQRNWSQIERSLQKQNLHLMKEVVDGTIHCKPGAAELLLQEVYTVLTNRSVRYVQIPEPDFTDQEYQEFLPAVARSTASKAIKNNLTMTEIMAEPDIITNQRKAEVILHRHLEHKAAERVLYPRRFKVKPNLGQLADKNVVSSSRGDECSDSPSSADTASQPCSSSTWRGAAVPFKEIKSSGLIAVDSDHLCPDGGVEAAWCVSLSANQGVTTPFCKGLKEFAKSHNSKWNQTASAPLAFLSCYCRRSCHKNNWIVPFFPKAA